MARNILFKLLFCFFCNQIFLFDLNPYENYYSSKPTGSVKETLEKISENSWKISSFGKHPLFTIKQESIFSMDDGNVILESGLRKLDILGGLRKDHQTYKVEKEGNQKISEGMEYGKSITDACVDWEETKKLLDDLAQAVKARR